MNRKSKRRILFGLKVVAICGAAVFMVKGVRETYTLAQNGTGNKEENSRVQVIEEVAPHPDVTIAVEERATVQKKEQEEQETVIASMDWDSDDAYMLAKIAMAEAESEGVEGKALVMLVVLNRVWSDDFPDTIEEVIYERTSTGGWQFSPMQDGGRWYTTEPDQECYEALELIQIEKWDESQGALYFESEGKSNWHRENLEFLFQYGNHYFYK